MKKKPEIAGAMLATFCMIAPARPIVSGLSSVPAVSSPPDNPVAAGEGWLDVRFVLASPSFPGRSGSRLRSRRHASTGSAGDWPLWGQSRRGSCGLKDWPALGPAKSGCGGRSAGVYLRSLVQE